jgi:SAM-dependent MidA family methyltransferase
VRPHGLRDVPEPAPAAREHSARVVGAVRREIADAGGWISFAQYMQTVLYAPGLGYYVAGARKFGEAGDFVTAPEMTPLFAQSLAAPIGALLADHAPRTVLELGAGSGALAADLLAALDARGTRDVRYTILEVGPELVERQRAALAARAFVSWVNTLPAAIDGVVLMNEVLDAVPPHVVSRRGADWLERGVAWSGGLVWAERPLPVGRLLDLATARFPPEGDYTSEVNPAAEALVESIARRLRHGAIVAIDYGFARGEYYHPQRSAGTLVGHYRHRVHDDPFLWPGLSDLTAHVDFTAIAEAGVRAGASVEGYASLAAFLVAAGILDGLAATGAPTSTRYLREASAVQRLLSPAEMGELFKVIVLAKKSDGIVWPYFQAADRAHRL